MPDIVIPVGLAMGPVFDSDEPSENLPSYYEVHLWALPAELTASEVAVWSAPFIDPGRHAKAGVDRARIKSVTAGAVADVDTVVDSLIDRGLLVEFDPIDDPVRDLLDGLQIHPTAVGLGTTAERPDVGTLGLRGEPMVVVNNLTYALWSYSMRYRSIWQACQELAESKAEDETADDEDRPMTVGDLARVIANDLSLLVLTGCAFLDHVAP